VTGISDASGSLEAVVFDMDGVLVDSEEIWDEARRKLALERGLAWPASAQRDMMGMSSLEWSRYMHERVGLTEAPEEISAEVVSRLEDLYWQHLPLMEGAVQAVERMAKRFRLGLASSSNRPIIELVLELAAVADYFEVTVSSEEVEHGKPAPDVYLEALKRMNVAPSRAAAVEDSTNGLLSAGAAGMLVVAVPNPVFPPRTDALAAAAVVIDSLTELTPELINNAASA
jgi:haloacid dehalogenase superfamily, subfamily IA, variant 3 with third motif having DD or ED